MGLNLKDLIKSEHIELSDLKGKKIAVDAFNIIFQFLSAIRDHRGNLFTDKKGRVTSHLMGLFYRTVNLLEAGIKPCFVFDGSSLELKGSTMESRALIKEEAKKKLEEARKTGDYDLVKRYAQQVSYLTQDMIDEAKKLLDALGLPHLEAKHDAEAQAAYMCQQGDVVLVGTEDWDSCLYGSPVTIRKLASKKGELDKVVLKDALKELGLTREELVKAAVLIGTDFNQGVKGVGPKTAVKLVKEGKWEEASKDVENRDEVVNIFLNPEVVKKYKLEWKPVNAKRVVEFLCEDYSFSRERVENALKRIVEPKQKGLGDFFRK